MAECSRCGAALIATARFCAACGRPVAIAGAVAPTRPSAVVKPQRYDAPVVTVSPPSSDADPFARTMQDKPAPIPTKPGVQSAAPPVAIVMPVVSPLASSLAASRPAPPRPGPKVPRTEPPPTLPAPGTPTPPAQARAQVPPMRAAQGSSPGLAPTPQPAPTPNPQAFQAPPQGYATPGYTPQAYAPPAYSPPAYSPGPGPRFAQGAVVLVHWADGRRYPGTVLQLSPTHVLVVFPNGHREWVDASYVTTGA